jgi:hypothetical protein
MDVDILLKALENEENSYLLDMTNKKIKDTNKKILSELHLSKDEIEAYMNKLKDYMYVEDMSQLKYGSFIRYIPITDPDDLPLKSGGIVCEMKITDEGVSIICKGFGFNTKHFQVKFDEVILFQKLTTQEKVLLNAVDYLNK